MALAGSWFNDTIREDIRSRGNVRLSNKLGRPDMDWSKGVFEWMVQRNIMEDDKEREEAQHVIDKAASGGYFDHFSSKANRSETHRELEQAAEDLLAGAYPNHRARVKAYPESEHVDIIVERIRKR